MKTLSRILFLSALLGACLSANAADKTPSTGATACKWEGDTKVCTTYKQAKKTYSAGYLKPEEVKQCLLDKRRIAADDTQLKTGKAALSPESDAILAEEKVLQEKADGIKTQGDKLIDQRKEIDVLESDLKNNEPGVSPSPREVDRYQKKVDVYKQLTTAFNPLNEAYRKQVDDYNAAVQAHHARVAKQNQAAEDINGRLAGLKTFSADFDKRCTRSKSYEDDVKAAEAAIAKEDAVQKK